MNKGGSEPFAMFSESGLGKSPSMAISSKSPSFLGLVFMQTKQTKETAVLKVEMS